MNASGPSWWRVAARSTRASRNRLSSGSWLALAGLSDMRDNLDGHPVCGRVILVVRRVSRDRPGTLKTGSSAPFRLSVRSTNSPAGAPVSPRDGAPGSHLARRRSSDSRLEAVTGKRREESGPPTKPSIAPPSPRPNAQVSALGDASPLIQLERAAPTLTYSVVIVLAAFALGLGAVMAAWSGGRQGSSWFAGTLLFVAVSTLI